MTTDAARAGVTRGAADTSASARARGDGAAARGGLPLAWRIFLGTSLIVAAVLGGALLWTSRSADRAAAVAASRAVQGMRAEVSAFVAGEGQGLVDGAAVFARSAGFRSLVAAGARADALDQSREAAEQLRAAWVQLLDARGVRLSKSDQPDAPSESLADSPLVRDALAGRARVAFGTLGDSALAHVAAVPIEGATPGVVVGVLMAARPLDAVAAQARASSGGEVAFVVLPREGAARPSGSAHAGAAAVLALAERTVRGEPEASGAPGARPGGATDAAPSDLVIDGERWLALVEPLRTAAGRPAGGFVVLRPRAAELAAFTALRRAILVAGAAGLVAALLMSFAVARQITRPLNALAAAARRAAAGDYAAPIPVTSRDEVGALAASFRALLDDLREKQVLVEFARLTPGRAAGRRWAATPPRAFRGAEPAAGGGTPAALPAASATVGGSTGGSAGGATTPFVRAAAVPGGAGGAELAAEVRPVERDPAPAPRVDDSSTERVVPRRVASDTRRETPRDVPVAPRTADVVTAAAALRPGQTFAERYRIESMIGAGGTGVVFRAVDLRRGELVALKVLRPDVAQDDPAALARLVREAETARQLEHPNVVRTYDLGEADGLHFLTMEYVAGASLREMLDARGALPIPAAVASVRQLCRALAHAHARGVLHRDVKPHNCIVTEGGVLKVMDFGIARFADRPRGVTETGIVIGTPAYMAPEVLRGAAYDARADVYAAGAVLYECLVGEPPFEQPGAALAVVSLVLEAEPQDPLALRPEIPRALADAALEALAKDPRARPQTADALGDRLAPFG